MSDISIIFDLDGTLLDTLEDLAVTVNEVLADHGMAEHNINAYKGFIGDGLTSLIERSVAPGTDQSVVIRMCDEFKKRYECNWCQHCRPYPGIIDVLQKLQKRQIDCAVLSNKPHEFTLRFVQHYFSQNTFRVIYGQRSGFAKKPAPDIALAIANELGRQPDEMFFVGDSGVDMQTAQNAGMHGIGVLWGFREKEELLRGGAEFLVNKPKELLLYV